MLKEKYCYRHIVSFEETNLVGNVYFSNYIKWQGLCREKFLMDYAPEILHDLYNKLALITLNCSCEYYDQLIPFDNVRIEMRLKKRVQNRISMEFLYIKEKINNGEITIAKGNQETCVMQKHKHGMSVCELPNSLLRALKQFNIG
jgi:enediyne core biosynthesis thioesterase